VDARAWEVPPIFRWLQESGRVPIDDMMRTFNMGIGLVLVASAARGEQLIGELAARGGRDARVIGEVVAGEPRPVTYTNLS
jgi:phosphoribosylformylglycinamidine cyclo-ligase